MENKKDQVKERHKEAAGVLATEESRKTEGKVDRLVSQMKEKAAKATEKMRRVLAGKPFPHRTTRRG